MPPQDLLALRNQFERHNILLAFNGLFSATLIEEIGLALRKHLEALSATPTEVTDVFTIYIEMTQNIRHYTREKNWSDQQAGATVVVSRDDQGRYVVSAGNLIETADGQVLLNAVAELAKKDKAELKALYKEQLRKPRDEHVATGAGLGLIDIARKSSEPLKASLQPVSGELSFISLSAVI